MYVFEIIKLQFDKKMSYIALWGLCILAFFWNCFLIISKKNDGYPQFSFGISIALANVCMSRHCP